jgi:hypothetical protein
VYTATSVRPPNPVELLVASRFSNRINQESIEQIESINRVSGHEKIETIVAIITTSMVMQIVLLRDRPLVITTDHHYGSRLAKMAMARCRLISHQQHEDLMAAPSLNGPPMSTVIAQLSAEHGVFSAIEPVALMLSERHCRFVVRPIPYFTL